MKKIVTFSIPLFVLLFTQSCSRYQMIKYNTYQISTVDNNVCKKLYGRVILYAVFVDSRYTQPWLEYDINSTLDSITKAKLWLEKLASENGVALTIDIKFHQAGKTIPITANLQDKSLSQTLFSPTPYFGIPKFDRWSRPHCKNGRFILTKGYF